MVVDFKEGESTAHKGAMHPIIPTPQSLIVVAMPQLQVKSAKGVDLLHDLELWFELIQGQVATANAHKTIWLWEVVCWTQEWTKNEALHKALLADHSDIVWRHGQEKMEIEWPLIQLKKDVNDLRRRVKIVSTLCAPVIQEELRKLEVQMLSVEQEVSKKIAAATVSHEHQIKSLQSCIDVIVFPPPPPNKRKSKPALFDPEYVVKKAPGSCISFEYMTDDIFEFASTFPACFDRSTILTGPETFLPDVGSNSMTFWLLDTMMSSAKSESVFFCQGRVFLHGLELIPIYDNRALELANPSVEDLAPFVQSGFGRPHIDCLFLAHHWHCGDKLRYNDDHSCWYYLREIVWNDLTVQV